MDTGNIIVTGMDGDAILGGIEAAIAMHAARKAVDIAREVPAGYQIANTAERVVKLILGTARLSNGWDGIRMHDYV